MSPTSTVMPCAPLWVCLAVTIVIARAADAFHLGPSVSTPRFAMTSTALHQSSKAHSHNQHHGMDTNMYASTTSADEILEVSSYVDLEYKTFFRSDPRHTYMEDVDSYNTMWHVNHVKVYSRALHSTMSPAFVSSSMHAHKPQSSLAHTKCVVDYDDWSIVKMTNLQYKTALRLGGEYIVEGRLLRRVDETNVEPQIPSHFAFQFEGEGDAEFNSRSLNTNENGHVIGGSMAPHDVWEVTIRCPNDCSIVYSTAEVTLARPSSAYPGSDLGCLPNPGPHKVVPKCVKCSTIHRDEFDGHVASQLPLTTAMSHMDRSRIDMLGDSSSLQRLKGEDDIIFLIGSFEAAQLLQHHDGTVAQCHPGDELVTTVSWVPQKHGMLFDVYHTIFKVASPTVNDDRTSDGEKHNGDSANQGEMVRLAQAKLTLVAYNTKRDRPTSKFPSWFRESIGLE
eukprot:CAMPEP_0198117788 /NCGR_PEP_ID=MMETSP1442-20131203/19277_1 /TAXON_ID= /ORGANISM="Craspedostauros australis, Strain CCMP3328" /LENGTH=449 /DNA_ID=CAMNT_0043775911 /DNA_START=206 /DNA_END=1555 /DNA_ORIENTATION=+